MYDRTGVKFADAVEALRVACVAAMKAGHLVLLDCTDKPPAFRDKICEHAKYKARILFATMK